jgi:hypothetical protein
VRAKRPPKAKVEAAIRGAGGNLTAAASRLAGIQGPEIMRAAPLDPTALYPTSLRLPGALLKWTKKHAIDTDRNASAVVVEALELLRAIVEGGGES